MVQAKPRFKTIGEYAALTTSDLPELRFELVDGEIVEMGAEADQNVQIAIMLMFAFGQFVPIRLLRRGSEVQVTSVYVTCREPDLIVLTEEGHSALQRDKRSIITLDMPNPALVVEVVSQGTENSDNYQRDYVAKVREYAARGIPEYWRIDPQRGVVTVLVLAGQSYQETDYRGSNLVVSLAFPGLQLTTEQILNAG
jgi:Uma2 family endonuclease